MKAAVRLALLGAGLGLFAWFVWRAGPREVLAALERLGPWLPLVLLPYLLVYAVDTLGWKWSWPGKGSGVGYGTLFRVRWCGEAVNNVIPSAWIGGEVIKIHLLGKRGVPRGSSAAATVVSKTVQSLAQVVYLAVAAVVFWRITPAGTALRHAALVVALAALAAVAVMFWVQRRGIGEVLFAVFRRLRRREPDWLARREPQWRALDGQVRRFYREHPRRFAACAMAFLGGWLLDTLEIWVVGRVMGMPITWPQALVIEAFTSVVKVMGMAVPGALGVQEGGIVVLARLAGAPPALGPAYAIIRRAREVVFALIGWVWLYAGESGWRELRRRIIGAKQ